MTAKRILVATITVAMVCTMGLGLVGCGGAGTGSAAADNQKAAAAWSALNKGDGAYTAKVTLTGGSGKASVASPAKIEVKDGAATAEIIWSSPNYDYMIVDGEKYTPQIEDGHSVFEIPVTAFNAEMPVTADTTAMSTPHEIEYTLDFDSSSLEER